MSDSNYKKIEIEYNTNERKELFHNITYYLGSKYLFENNESKDDFKDYVCKSDYGTVLKWSNIHSDDRSRINYFILIKDITGIFFLHINLVLKPEFELYEFVESDDD